MSRCLLVAFLVAACGGKSPSPDPGPTQGPQPQAETLSTAELTDALAPAAFLVGDWKYGDTRTHWVAAGGTLYGVTFRGTAWSVEIVDDGDGKSDTADGKLRLIDLGWGWSESELPATEVGANRLRFGGDGMIATLALQGDTLVETFEVKAMAGLDRGTGREEHGSELVGRDPTARASGDTHYYRATDAAAPELEAADRQFDADTEAEKVAGWVKWFAETGVLWRGERIEGRAAIGTKLTPTLTTGHLRWAPIASRSAGDVGFTVGTATWTANDATEPAWRGSYITIWRKQADGRWLVEFDTGRANQPAR